MEAKKPIKAPVGTVAIFIDVDGYGPQGIDNRIIVGQDGSDGYRARELGWLYCALEADGSERRETGSIFFVDEGIPPLQEQDPSVRFIHARLHGLPINPRREEYSNLRVPVFRSDQLCETIFLLWWYVLEETGAQQAVMFHKGGNEGHWIRSILPDISVIDLGNLGCPKVDVLGKDGLAWTEHPSCHLHGGGPLRSRGRSGGIVHCPCLEVNLLAKWLASFCEETPGGGSSLTASLTAEIETRQRRPAEALWAREIAENGSRTTETVEDYYNSNYWTSVFESGL